MGGTPVLRGMRGRHGGGRLPLAVLLLIAPLSAAYGEAHDLLDNATGSLSLYEGQGVDEDLRELPGHLASGSVEWDDSYFTGLGYLHRTETPNWLSRMLGWISLERPTTGVELVAVQHRGLQENFEANLAYAIHTPYAALGPVRVRFGMSVGLSYAFGNPSYEDGPKDDPEERYRFQNYNAYELEWGLWKYPRVSLVTRIHHRSGAYGLVAPRRVGSNFLAAAVRVKW